MARNFFITWEEEKNALLIRPSEAGFKQYILTKENIVSFNLEYDGTKITSTLDGILEYLCEKLTKEDALSLASMLYSWGQYNGAKLN